MKTRKSDPDVQVNESDEKKAESDDHLYDADPDCKHDIEMMWSGIRCKKCHGWNCL